MFTVADFGFTDPNDNPDNNFVSVTITTLPLNGTLTLGAGSSAPGTVIAGQVITVADIPFLTFTPVADANGTAYASFTFRVTDDDGIANGGQDTDQSPNTITVDVTSVNDEPAGADNSVSTLEDTPYTFSSGQFGFSDVDDAPAPNNLSGILVTTLPSSGVLTLAAGASVTGPVTAGQFISTSDLDYLTFTPGTDGHGIPYTGFTFQVVDDGGTANGGQDTDQTPNTMTIDVIEVNDAPDGTDNTVTTLEDTDYTFHPSDFGFTDAHDNPANALQSVIITSLPVDGSLFLAAGASAPGAVVAGQAISVTDIPFLTFSPSSNENGTGYASFTFQVADDGGTANSGEDTDPTPNTMNIDVTSVNDEPIGTDNTVTTLEDTPYVFNPSIFGFTDPDDNPANALESVIITTLPVSGTLSLGAGSSAPGAVVAGQLISVADLSYLTFMPDAHQNGAAYASFTFQVVDDDGTLNAGQDTDQTPNVVTIDVTPMNDAPHTVDNSVTILEDNTYTFQVSDFAYSDPYDVPSNNYTGIIITTLPANGTLTLGAGSSAPGTVAAGQFISIADIPFMEYAPVLNGNGVDYGTFTFQVVDDGGTAITGEQDTSIAHTFHLDVTPVDDPPVLDVNTGLSMFEGQTVTITTAMLSSSDVDTMDSDIVYTITSPVVNGRVALVSAPGVAITSFTQDDLAHGRVIYIHDSSETTSDSFDFTVSDALSTLASSTFPITITLINDEPLSSDNAVTTLEDTDYVFGLGDFAFSDPNDAVSNNFQSVRIVTLPVSGALTLGAGSSAPGPVVAGQYISIADIPFLTYSPALNGNGADYGTFTFQVQDDGGTANGGVDLSAIHTMHVNVTPVNDAPDDITMSRDWFPEGNPVGWTVANLSTHDVDSSNFTYSIVSGPAMFSIVDNRLVLTSMLIYGVDPESYVITLRTNDGFLTYDETFTIRMIEQPVVVPETILNKDIGGDKNGPAYELTPTKAEMFISETMKNIHKDGYRFYGNEGLLDASLSLYGHPMDAAYYMGSAIDQIIRSGITLQILEILEGNDKEIPYGTDIRTILHEIELAQILRGDLGVDKTVTAAGDEDEAEKVKKKLPEDVALYKDNKLYEALVGMRSGKLSPGPTDELSQIDRKEHVQYLQAQLDEAALYYRSKHNKLMDALDAKKDKDPS
jgi:hypothetical protein